jgi:hypothetical protein
MAIKEWTRRRSNGGVEEVSIGSNGKFEMRPNGPGTARNVQYVQVWGEGDEMGVLPAAKHKSHRNEKSITQLCGPDRNLDRVSVSHNPS